MCCPYDTQPNLTTSKGNVDNTANLSCSHQDGWGKGGRCSSHFNEHIPTSQSLTNIKSKHLLNIHQSFIYHLLILPSHGFGKQSIIIESPLSFYLYQSFTYYSPILVHLTIMSQRLERPKNLDTASLAIHPNLCPRYRPKCDGTFGPFSCPNLEPSSRNRALWPGEEGSSRTAFRPTS